MNTLQRYVLNSLFEHKQITEEKLAKTLDTLTDETINDILTILVTEESTTLSPEMAIPEDIDKNKLILILHCERYASVTTSEKHLLVGNIKRQLGFDLKTAKDIVDSLLANDIYSIEGKDIAVDITTFEQRNKIELILNSNNIKTKFTYK